MTDQELYYKLEPEGCWHEWDNNPNNNTFRMCKKCRKYQSELPVEEQENLDFATWEGFGWLWERASDQDWWDYFLFVTIKERCYTNYPDDLDACCTVLIHPVRFRDALKEYFKDKKDDNN